MKNKLFAAIDVGSTCLSMKIAAVSKKDGIIPVDEVRYMLSLGTETYTIGKIRYPLLEEMCGVMEEFARIMKEYGVEAYTAYATTAVREASNSEYIIDRINLRTGLKVGILSNAEEHFLHNKALALYDSRFDEMIENGAVIVDLSSGSVQVSLYENSQLRFSQNIPLGSLRVAESVSEFEDTSIKFSGIVKELLENGIRRYRTARLENSKTKYFILTGSLVSYIKAVCKKEDSEFLDYSDLEKAYKKLSDTSLDELCSELDISHEKASALLTGLMFYMMFIDFDKEKKIFAADLSLIDGICVEYVEKQGYTHTKHIFTEDIISSAKYYADKYRCSSEHYEFVCDACNELFRAVSKKFGLSKRDRVLLNVAAIMADTGNFINVNDYSKYSFDIVTANRLLGLSDKEIKTIAYTVLFHAKGVMMDTPGYNQLTKSHRLLISKLTAVLSLAKTLDCGYNGKIKKIKAGFKKEEMYVRAYSAEDITIEKNEFDDAAEFFEDVFGIKPELTKISV